MEMKRILKYLLCLLLVFTLIPSVVFAQDSTDTSTENEEVVTEEIGIIEEEEVIEEESDDYDVESLEDEATVVLDQYSLVTASSSNYYTFSSDTGLTESDNTITITASGTLQLLTNTKSNIVIGDGTNTIDVTIDLNGYTLTGTGSTSVILVKSYASLTLKDSSSGGTVSGGNATNGGGVSISSSATFTLESGIISGNSATYGGGVYINNATFYMNGGTISNNTAKSYGGGIEVTNGGTLILKEGTISYNVVTNSTSSTTYGGGIDIDSNGTFEMYSGSIKNNSASYGGGVYIYQNVTFKMDEGTISNNAASIRGGGICVGSQGSFVMNGGTISNNTASSRGGGVNTYGSFVMNDGEICNNSATTWGGGVQVVGNASFIMNDGDIYKNSANYGGGISVYSVTASFIMNNGNIYENEALYGGAVELDISGTITINDGIIKNNRARTGGGIAIINDWGSAYGPLYFTLNGGTISGNTAYYQSGKSLSGVGGGIFLWANSATHEFIINAGNIINNIAETGSGGIHVNYNTTLTIKDVLITENSTTILGGGVYNCEKGNTYTYITDGAAIFDNSSTSAQDSTLVAAGDDFTNLYDSSFGDTEIKLSLRILGGGSIDYYYDGGIQYYKADDSMGDY